MSRLAKFAALPSGERLLLVRAAGWLAFAALTIHILPLQRLQAMFCRRPVGVRRSLLPPERLAWHMQTASRFVPGASCLAQALAGNRIFRGAGYEPVIRIGVLRNEDSIFRAHAWLELEGKVLLGDQPELAEYRTILNW